jgi:hypothetical protein
MNASHLNKFTKGSKSGKKHPLGTTYQFIYRIKKPKGWHMTRRCDWGGPLIENGRTNEQTNDDRNLA